jgi:transposase InsO family protein
VDVCSATSSAARPPIAALTAPPPPLACLDLPSLSAAQKVCPEVTSVRTSPSLDVVYRLCGDSYIYGDISTPVFRPLLPPAFRRPVFEAFHAAGHPGRQATKRLVSSRFVWPRLAQQVTQWARECIPCQLAKTHRHVVLPPAAIPVPTHRFSHINVDLVGPLPSSGGFAHLFTIVDRCSRWPEAIPLASTSAADCARALFAGWICRFGIPSCITSDRGPQFTSSLWAALCSLLSIRHSLLPAYHPQANGLVERFHRRLKDALRARGAGADWIHHLPWVLLSVRAATADDSSPSPAESLYGSQLVLPGQLVAAADPPLVSSFVESLQRLVDSSSPPPTHHNAASTAAQSAPLPQDLLHARMVFVRRDESKPPLAPAYAGPYEVLSRSPSTFKLQIGGKSDIVATSRLKATQLPLDAAPAAPRRRGRPPAAPRVAPSSPPSGRVRFAIPDAPVPPPPPCIPGRPTRLRRPPERFSLSAVGCKTVGGRCSKPLTNVVFSQYLSIL